MAPGRSVALSIECGCRGLPDARLDSLQAPVGSAWGLNLHAQQCCNGLMPQVPTGCFEHSAHRPHLEEPARYLQVLQDFL